MIQRLASLWQSIRTGLWAVPVTMAAVACALAAIASSMRIDIGNDPVWFLYSGDAEAAPQFLSSLLTAIITMATLAISITMVVLTLAAQQLGPRLIRSFMSDLRTQISLGLLFATVVYLLLVLRASYGSGDSAPNLAVTIGAALALISVLNLPLFVHHLACAIVSDNVIRRIGEQLDREIVRLLPAPDDRSPVPAPPDLRADGAPFRIARGGYLQAVDFDRLVAIARQHSVQVQLDVRAGHHILAGNRCGWIAPSNRADANLERQIFDCMMLGSERTPLQDLEFSIRQLVEIALRALSPGINDPFTAITVVDRLSLSVGCVMRRAPAQAVRCDGDGRVRVIAPVSSFDGILDAAFHQIRQLSTPLPAVLIRLVENLTQLAEQADERQRPNLLRHLNLALEAGRRGFADPADIETLEARARAAGG